MERRPKKPVNTGEWLNTYADMITLVLCFFVLLYSMSNVDKNKFENFVMSINPDLVVETPPLIGPGQSDASSSFDDIFGKIQQAIETQQLQAQMTAYRGEGFVLISFQSSLLFNGDSYALRPDAIAVLDNFTSVIDGLNDEIGELRVLGHTTQADPNRPNSTSNDRFLASNRATEVVVYLQNKGVVDAKKIIPESFGQHYPIAPIDTEESRAKNRRVEILLSKIGNVNISVENAYESAGIELIN